MARAPVTGADDGDRKSMLRQGGQYHEATGHGNGRADDPSHRMIVRRTGNGAGDVPQGRDTQNKGKNGNSPHLANSMLVSGMAGMLSIFAGSWSAPLFLSVYSISVLAMLHRIRDGQRAFAQEPDLLREFVSARLPLALVAMALGICLFGVPDREVNGLAALAVNAQQAMTGAAYILVAFSGLFSGLGDAIAIRKHWWATDGDAPAWLAPAWRIAVITVGLALLGLAAWHLAHRSPARPAADPMLSQAQEYEQGRTA